MKHLHKIQELKEKRDEESLKLVHNDPLVSISIDCRFDFLKIIPNSMCLKVIQKVIVVNNTHRFKHSIKVATKKNDEWLVALPFYFLKKLVGYQWTK